MVYPSASRIIKLIAVAWGVVIPAVLVIMYSAAGVLFGLFAMLQPLGSVAIYAREMGALYLIWGLAGFCGFLSIGYALFCGVRLPLSRWLVAGWICTFVAFGAFLAMLMFGNPAESTFYLRFFWFLIFLGPFTVSLYFLVSAACKRKNEKPNHSSEPTPGAVH